MTISGAKGSLVNFSQIAAALGQQELEGRRVPRMPSGRTLPCFEPFDISARANGYIACRFFSGLDPPEYFSIAWPAEKVWWTPRSRRRALVICSVVS